jgi:hypothetical protein
VCGNKKGHALEYGGSMTNKNASPKNITTRSTVPKYKVQCNLDLLTILQRPFFNLLSDASDITTYNQLI